jgi:hypothetical protein
MQHTYGYIDIASECNALLIRHATLKIPKAAFNAPASQ